MNIELMELPPVTVACLRYTGPFGPAIAPFWRTTVAAWMEQEGFLGRARYGISQDDPCVTPPERLRYDAGVEAPVGYVPTGEALLSHLPGGLYAVLPFTGLPSRIGEAWHGLMDVWLPRSGYRHAGSPPYEYMPADGSFNPETGEIRCEIRVPVVR